MMERGSITVLSQEESSSTGVCKSYVGGSVEQIFLVNKKDCISPSGCADSLWGSAAKLRICSFLSYVGINHS